MQTLEYIGTQTSLAGTTKVCLYDQ